MPFLIRDHPWRTGTGECAHQSFGRSALSCKMPLESFLSPPSLGFSLSCSPALCPPVLYAWAWVSSGKLGSKRKRRAHASASVVPVGPSTARHTGLEICIKGAAWLISARYRSCPWQLVTSYCIDVTLRPLHPFPGWGYILRGRSQWG